MIVAGGTGRRMGGPVPKQFMELNGKPVILHTLERFLEFDPDMAVVVVLAPGHRSYWEKAAAGGFPDIALATGGETRYDSVKNGIGMMESGTGLIGIHDAVRPLVSVPTLERCYASAGRTGSGIPVVEVDETIRIMKDRDHSEHMDRSLLRRVQTPQVFKGEQIRNAYRLPFHPAFTDDASVYESMYGEVSLVEGNPENIKITTPVDLMLASLLMGLPPE